VTAGRNESQNLLRLTHDMVADVLKLVVETIAMEQRLDDTSNLRNLYRVANWHRLFEMIESLLARSAFVAGSGPEHADELERFIGRNLTFQTDEGWVGVIAKGELLYQRGLSPDIEERLKDRVELLSRSYETAVRSTIASASITSPIEQMFLIEWKVQQIEFRHGLALVPQYEVDVKGTPFRVDFLVRGADVSILVELDGHDFHEKTPEQAARDRARERALLLATGHRLLRFTGREVHQDVKKCIREILDHAGVEHDIR
jgi:very-short-patch-repair endonuclease